MSLGGAAASLELATVLTTSPGEVFAVADLASRLETSRAGVWKLAESLREEGLPVEGNTHGYWLAADAPVSCPPAARYEYRGRVASTQDEARALARDGAPSFTTVFAEHQVAGRGRGGGAWVGLTGAGLAFTVVVRPPISAAELAPLPLLAGVAVCAAIRAATGVDAGLKWPNDVLAPDGRKLAGMLVEAEIEDGLPHFALIGIGVNVRRMPFPAGVPGASIEEFAAAPVHRARLLTDIIERLREQYRALLEEGPSEGIAAWRSLSCTLGREVSIRRADGTAWEGTARDVDHDGALVVETRAGSLRRVVSGEVSLRHKGGRHPMGGGIESRQ